MNIMKFFMKEEDTFHSLLQLHFLHNSMVLIKGKFEHTWAKFILHYIASSQVVKLDFSS